MTAPKSCAYFALFLLSFVSLCSYAAGQSYQHSNVLILASQGALLEYDPLSERMVARHQLKSTAHPVPDFRNLAVIDDRQILVEHPSAGILEVDLETGLATPLPISGRCPIFLKESDSIVTLRSKGADNGFESSAFIIAVDSVGIEEQIPIEGLELGHYADCPLPLDDGSLLFKKVEDGVTSFVSYDAQSGAVRNTRLPGDCRPLIALEDDDVLCRMGDEYNRVSALEGVRKDSEISFTSRSYPRLYLNGHRAYLMQLVDENGVEGIRSDVAILYVGRAKPRVVLRSVTIKSATQLSSPI